MHVSLSSSPQHHGCMSAFPPVLVKALADEGFKHPSPIQASVYCQHMCTADMCTADMCTADMCTADPSVLAHLPLQAIGWPAAMMGRDMIAIAKVTGGRGEIGGDGCNLLC